MKSDKELTREVLKRCKHEQIDVDAGFVDFLVTLGLACAPRPNEGMYINEEVNYRNVFSDTMDRLREKHQPSFSILQLQSYFGGSYLTRESVIGQQRNKLESKMAPFIKEICEVRVLENTQEIEKLYQKMLVAITLLSGLGNPTIPADLRDVAVALQSVLQPSELPRYVTLPEQEKEEQLKELVYIVAGIRLFNRDCHRGGEGIDDLPSILQVGVNRTRCAIIQLLEWIMEKVYVFTAIAEANVRTDLQKDTVGVRADDVLWATQMLVGSRQQEIYVRRLLADLDVCEEEVRCLVCRMQNRLLQLHESVKFRTAVPTNLVYPKFVEIAQIWMKLQDEVLVLSYLNDTFSTLQNLFPQSIDRHYEEVIQKLLGNAQIMTDAERLAQTMGKLIASGGQCPIAFPGADVNMDKIHLQLLGFCPWSFAMGDGALIPGNPNIGVAEWQGKCYAFSSIEAAELFGAEPKVFMETATKIFKERIEYVQLFQILEELQALNVSQKGCLPLKVRHDREVQTETHVFPKWIDINYSSSLWGHRQRALRIAHIYRCMTKSTQTVVSNFRKGISLQTLEPKEKEAQTKKDSSTNTENLKKFIVGLRGRGDNVYFFDYPPKK